MHSRYRDCAVATSVFTGTSTNIRCVRKKEREIVIATDSRRQLVILSGCSAKAPANKLPEGPIARSQKRRGNGKGRIETIATTDRENIAPANWTGVAMWFCCLLGVACVLFGIDGIYAIFSQEASSVRFEWLGFGYVPLRPLFREECSCAAANCGATRTGFDKSEGILVF